MLTVPAETILRDLAEEWHGRAVEIHITLPPSPHNQRLQAAALAISDVLLEAAGWDRCDICGDHWHLGKRIGCACDTCSHCGGDRWRCDCYNLWLVSAAEAKDY